VECCGEKLPTFWNFCRRTQGSETAAAHTSKRQTGAREGDQVNQGEKMAGENIGRRSQELRQVLQLAAGR